MKRLCFAALIVSLISAGGCRTTDVMNFTDRPATTIDGSVLSEDQVEQAILEGMAVRGWRARERSPGRMTAELNLRQHRAIVEITYDARLYSIKYLDSEGLRADDGEIHRNYNRWVKNLDADIQRKLAELEAVN